MIRAAARAAAVAAVVFVHAGSSAHAAEPAGRSATPPPDARPCPATPTVRVSATDPRDAETACAGASDAVGFFEARGLRLFDAVTLDVRDALPAPLCPRAAGCWLPDAKRIVMLDRAAFLRQRIWLGIANRPALHRSVATHEVAHALAACNFIATRPPRHAQEYVAYVVALATMDPSLRAAVLKATPGDGFATVSTIGELLYAFDTQRFGIESWRHYAKPENGDAFLRRVLSGEALAD